MTSRLREMAARAAALLTRRRHLDADVRDELRFPLAHWIPLRRAARVDPAIALRQD